MYISHHPVLQDISGKYGGTDAKAINNRFKMINCTFLHQVKPSFRDTINRASLKKVAATTWMESRRFITARNLIIS